MPKILASCRDILDISSSPTSRTNDFISSSNFLEKAQYQSRIHKVWHIGLVATNLHFKGLEKSKNFDIVKLNFVMKLSNLSLDEYVPIYIANGAAIF